MKKIGVLSLLLVLVLLSMFSGMIQAQDTPGIPDEVKTLQKASEALTNEQVREEYLKKEWGAIARNSTFFGPIVKGYEKVSPLTDPIFKYTIGMTPSLSWMFVLTLVIWITLFIYIFRAITIFSGSSTVTLIAITLLVMIFLSIQALDAKIILFIITAVIILAILISLELNILYSLLISAVSSFTMTAFISPIVASTLLKNYEPLKLFGIPTFLATLIIKILSPLKIWWVQILVLVFLIALMIWADVKSDKVKEFFGKLKEKREKMFEALNRQKLEGHVKRLENLYGE